jgi:hypothetical protein
MKHPIPDDALDDRLGFCGTAGSGKTYNAGGAVERVLARGGRVVIPDPLGVWWGLRVMADGNTSSPHKVVIIGGAHGDLPITEQAGALIGETVAGMAESCVLDLSQLGTKAAERRFMLAFLTALYRHATGEPVHVVFDEADMWAPQRLMDRDGDAPRLLGMMETIVRRGRVKGFIPWLITQRPAVLSKDVLSQVDGLVAFKLTSSQDRDAIGAWVEGSADKQQWRDIWAALPTMQRGQGVVWVPARDILATVKFPEKRTFDSSRTPKRGESKRTAKLKPINLDKLQEKLAAVKAEVDANDPKALRAEVANLKKELARKSVPPAPVADKDALDASWVLGFNSAMELSISLFDTRRKTIAEKLKLVCADIMESLVFPSVDPKTPKPANGSIRVLPRQPSSIPMPSVNPTRGSRPGVGDSNLSGPEQRILNSVATWGSWGQYQPSNAQVAWLAGYSPSSSSYANPRGALKAKGLLELPGPGLVSITPDGSASATPIVLAGSLLDLVLSKLSGPEARILRGVADQYPRSLTNEEAAIAADYSPTSSSYASPRGSLKSKDLISSVKGQVRAADWLFVSGAA